MPVEGLINCDGADNDYWYFSTRSWSGTAEEYTIVIDRRNGTIQCTCMDAVCRHKTDRIYAKTPNVCKHARAVLRWAAQLTGEQT